MAAASSWPLFILVTMAASSPCWPFQKKLRSRAYSLPSAVFWPSGSLVRSRMARCHVLKTCPHGLSAGAKVPILMDSVFFSSADAVVAKAKRDRARLAAILRSMAKTLFSGVWVGLVSSTFSSIHPKERRRFVRLYAGKDGFVYHMSHDSGLFRLAQRKDAVEVRGGDGNHRKA